MEDITLPVTENFIPQYAFEGKIGRHWQIAGVTKVPATLDKIDIEVEFSADTLDRIKNLALRHEQGHADLTQDVVSAYGRTEDAFKILKDEYDPWQNECEAWIRGHGSRLPIKWIKAGQFVLDCLNSYRRGLNVTEEEWTLGTTVVIEALFHKDLWEVLKRYIPREPEAPEDFLQPCGEPDGDEFIPIPEPNEDGPLDEDPKEGDTERDGEGSKESPDGDGMDKPPTPESGPERDENPIKMDAPKLDKSWNDPDVVDLLDSMTIEEIGRLRGLDPALAPPLIVVMAKMKGRR